MNVPDDLKELYAMCDDWNKSGLSYERSAQVLRELSGPRNIRFLIERIATLEKALRNLCDSIEAAGGHDENGDVFDLTEAIAALEASK